MQVRIAGVAGHADKGDRVASPQRCALGLTLGIAVQVGVAVCVGPAGIELVERVPPDCERNSLATMPSPTAKTDALAGAMTSIP